MNNHKKFYDISGFALDIFEESIKKENDNYEYEKRKILKKLNGLSMENKLNFVLNWQFLIDFTFLGLNREKIEDEININWENYKPKNFIYKSPSLLNTGYSKIPYFKEWVKVLDCKDKYLTEGAHFWIQRIRNSLMHGNFLYDYDHPEKNSVKIFEGSLNSTDIKVDVRGLGLHEFIEDNFQNLDHHEFGVSAEFIDSLLITNNERISNRKQLEDILKNRFIISKRKFSSDYHYNGNDIVSNSTGEVVSRDVKGKKISVEDGEVKLQSKEYIDPKIKIYSVEDSTIETLVWILENKFNIYNSNRQKNLISKVAGQYLFPMEIVNRLLHEFDCYCGGLTCDKSEYKNVGIDMKKTMAVFNEFGDSINNVFTILKMYRLLYRLQNKNFDKLEYDIDNCERYFNLNESSSEEMQKRITKHKSLIQDSTLSEDDKNKKATNSAYIEVIRNALAHGNIDIRYIVIDNKLYNCFILTDDWTNKKTGERTIISLNTTDSFLNKLIKNLEICAQRIDDAVIQTETCEEDDLINK